jgi:hypothetical protein
MAAKVVLAVLATLVAPHLAKRHLAKVWEDDVSDRVLNTERKAAVEASNATVEDTGCAPDNCKACNKGKEAQGQCKEVGCQWMPGRFWGGDCVESPQCDPCGKCSTSSNSRQEFYQTHCQGWQGTKCEWKPGRVYGGDCVPAEECEPCEKCSTSANSRVEFFQKKCEDTFMCGWKPGKMSGGTCSMSSVREQFEHQNNMIEELQREVRGLQQGLTDGMTDH